MDNARAAQRRRMLKEGKVVLADRSVIDCVVRDLSDGGARVEFAGPTVLPQEFSLLVSSSNLLFPAELAWQRGQAAGLRFVGPGREAPPRKF